LAAPTRREFPWQLAAGGAAVAAIAFGIDDLRLRTFGQPSPPALDPFWQAVVRKGQPLSLTVPAPLFFGVKNQLFLARDFRVNRSE